MQDEYSEDVMRSLSAVPGPARSATDHEIKQLESEIGHKLPADYREFISVYGGFFVGVGIKIPEQTLNGEDAAFVASFHGILPGDERDLLTRYRWDRIQLPSELLTIASCENGYICLSTSEENFGSIYFWNSREGDSEQTYRHLYRLSSSFTEFLQSLHCGV